jgi:hypothetical protein
MRQQAERLACAVDWDRLRDTLRARRLLTILGPRLTELAGAHASEEFAETVRLAVDAGRRRGAFLQLIALHLMAALGEAGIRSTPLKGPLLGETLYGDAGVRPSSDIDLLVAPEQLRAAVAVVRELGYEEPTDHVDRHDLPLLHFKLLHTRRELPPVELHWRVHWYERNFARERLLPAPDARGERWRPAATDELAALLLFYARDGFVDLRLATDVGAWWDTFGHALEPGALTELIEEYPVLARVLTVAVKVAERVVGVPAERVLGDRARLVLRDRAAIRLANPNPRMSTPQLYADMGMVDALLTPPGHLGAFVRRQLLPPREVLAERARRTQEPPSTRLGHGARVLGRYGLTMTRLVHSPEALRLR